MGYSGSFLREFKTEPDFERGDGAVWAKKERRRPSRAGDYKMPSSKDRMGWPWGVRQVSAQRPGGWAVTQRLMAAGAGAPGNREEEL